VVANLRLISSMVLMLAHGGHLAKRAVASFRVEQASKKGKRRDKEGYINGTSWDEHRAHMRETRGNHWTDQAGEPRALATLPQPTTGLSEGRTQEAGMKNGCEGELRWCGQRREP